MGNHIGVYIAVGLIVVMSPIKRTVVTSHDFHIQCSCVYTYSCCSRVTGITSIGSAIVVAAGRFSIITLLASRYPMYIGHQVVESHSQQSRDFPATKIPADSTQAFYLWARSPKSGVRFFLKTAAVSAVFNCNVAGIFPKESHKAVRCAILFLMFLHTDNGPLVI